MHFVERFFFFHKFLYMKWTDEKLDYIDGFEQDCSNSSALGMELQQSCAKPSISNILFPADVAMVNKAKSC